MSQLFKPNCLTHTSKVINDVILLLECCLAGGIVKSIDGEEMTQEEVIKAVIEMLEGTNENGVEKDD
ncbi:hypothetical protein ACWIVY_02530 [Ursidibacter sp. B-7004-1]